MPTPQNASPKKDASSSSSSKRDHLVSFELDPSQKEDKTNSTSMNSKKALEERKKKREEEKKKKASQKEKKKKTKEDGSDDDDTDEDLMGNSVTIGELTMSQDSVVMKGAPKPKRFKKIKVFHLNKWTRRFSVLILLCCLLSTFVPQFLYYVPDSHTFGLFQECVGIACLPANFSVLMAHPSCVSDCNSDNKFRARFSAANAFLWLGALSSILLGITQYLHFARQYIVPLTGIMIPTIILGIFGVAALLIGLTVVASTLKIGYEATTCTQPEGCLVYGGSSYVGVFSLVLYIFGFVFAVVACFFHRHRLGVKEGIFSKIVAALPDAKLGSSKRLAEEAKAEDDERQEDEEKKLKKQTKENVKKGLLPEKEKKGSDSDSDSDSEDEEGAPPRTLERRGTEAFNMKEIRAKEKKEQEQQDGDGEKKTEKKEEGEEEEELRDVLKPRTEAEKQKRREAAEERKQRRQLEKVANLAAAESNFFAQASDGDFGQINFDDDEHGDADSTDSEADADEHLLTHEEEDEIDGDLTLSVTERTEKKEALRQKRREEIKAEKERYAAENGGKSREESEEKSEMQLLKDDIRHSRECQRVFNQMAMVCTVFTTVFAVAAVTSPRWIFLSPQGNSSKLQGYSVGLLAECTDQACTPLDYDKLLLNNTCGNDATTLEARLGFSALFYLLGAILCIPLYLTSSKECNQCLFSTTNRAILIGVTWLMVFFAVVLSMHTFDSWISCDIPWCEAFLSTNPKGSCEYGFMFATSLLSICLITVLATMIAIQSCCRPCGYEEKKKHHHDGNDDDDKKKLMPNVSSSPKKQQQLCDGSQPVCDAEPSSPPPPQVISTPTGQNNFGSPQQQQQKQQQQQQQHQHQQQQYQQQQYQQQPQQYQQQQNQQQRLFAPQQPNAAAVTPVMPQSAQYQQQGFQNH